jgi:hypothetical protein
MTDQDHAMAGQAGGAAPPPGTAPVVVGVPGLRAIIDALRGQFRSIIVRAVELTCATHFLDLRLLDTTGEHP